MHSETRQSLLYGRSPAIRRRRAIIVLSMLSAATAAVVALRQTGTIRHLPDPPGRGWDADRVSTSTIGFPFGIPDAPIGMASLASNVPLAAIGGESRSSSMPAVPLAAAVKSLTDMLVTLWFNKDMPLKLKRWCVYCLTASALNIAIFAFQVPEALEALRVLNARREAGA